MTGVLTKTGKPGHKHTRDIAIESRDWSHVSINQGTPRIPGNYQKLQERHETHSPSELPKGTNLVDTSVSDFRI